MRTMTVRMADLTFGVAFRHRRLARAFWPYRARGVQEFRVRATDEALCSIASRSAGDAPSPREVESLALLEAISTYLPARGAFLLHAACLAVNGAAYAFLAPSGTGKTTHMLNWLKLLGPDRAFVVNGDKPFLRHTGDGFCAYGTPWAGKENLHTQARVRLAALCFLERAPAEEIAPLPTREALSRLIRQVYLPQAEARVDRTLLLLDILVRSVPAYLLKCTASPDAARLAIDTMLREDPSGVRAGADEPAPSPPAAVITREPADRRQTHANLQSLRQRGVK